ncbi:MAG: glutamine--tRNA ligase, partial [Xanthomonas perforans]|nr:glutamine--tRNA ligase [Xanthomonas perforans]
ESFGSRQVPFARELWIDREDFAEVPPKGWKRLVPGGEVRLRGAGIIRCDEVIKDADGTITELRGWLDPESRPGMEGANRKVKGTIHWVSAVHAVPAEIRLYDRLFSVPNPDDESEGKTYRDYLNPESRRTVTGY